MRRRQFVHVLGAGIATISVSSSALAHPGGDPPNDRINTTYVYPFGTEENPFEVDIGDWITHRIGWADVYDDTTEADVERWLNAVEFSAWIDGEAVEDTEEHWGDVHYVEAVEAYQVFWEYTTPPKKPGLHTFTTELYYPDGYSDGGTVREPGTRHRFTGYYEVTPERDKK